MQRAPIQELSPPKEAEPLSKAVSHRDGEPLFRALAESTTVAILVFRQRILYVNPAAEQLTGYRADELAGMSSLELIHPDFREELGARLEARLAGGPVPSRYEAMILTKSGEERWVDYAGTRILLDGEPAVLASAVDITDRKEAELALYESRERLRMAHRGAKLLTWDWNLLADEIVVSEDAGLVLGFPLPAGSLKSRYLFERMVHPEDRDRLLAAVRAAILGDGDYSVEHRIVTTGGEVRWIAERGQAIRDETGWVVRMLGVSQDITDRVRTEQALRREQEWAETTLASIDDGVIRTGPLGSIEYMNRVAERLTGFSATDAIGLSLDHIYRVVEESSRVPLPHPVGRCLKEKRPVMLPGQRMLVARDGSEHAVRDSASPILGGGGELLGAVLAFKDVTAVRDIERERLELATHDLLTGLPNRSFFERRLARALERMAASAGCLVVLQLDLAQLKVVNDTCGHLAGDELIRQASRHLVDWDADRYSLARLGAEEFGLIAEATSASDARGVAESLRSALKGFRFEWQDRVYEAHANIGFVTARPGDTPTSLMIAADIACMVAKESGRDRIHEYLADDDALAQRYRQMDWIHRIHKALDNGGFCLYCQPIQPLDPAAAEGGLLGEVLIRMVNEEGELVLPRTFVPAAERYRVISKIDRWVVSRSFDLLARGASIGGRRLDRLAMNLSGETLADETFLDFVIEHLEATGVDPHRLLFEITETAAVANLDGALRFISELKARGVAFVLDDFGSGLSSFAYLKNLPVDYLKISGDFLSGIETEPINRTLVRSINQVGHELGLQVIGEGVESEEILSAVLDIRLDYVQGYWIAPPQPFDEI
ncbi:MAG TPA: EAL domain-containing protein [Thermoanaerobaculia bacterium]|nr:EAL domain-containing protein [Thermoanaerobaculia bacterium]